MKKIAIFASGGGSNFEAIAAACLSGEIEAEVVLMLCDKAGAGVIERAERLGIKALVLEPKSFGSKSEYEERIVEALDALQVDLVCLAGYMRIVGDTLLQAYEGRIINIHPSLLPAFKGATAIKDAFEYGVKVFGVSIHYVNKELDGGKIIAQRAFSYEGESQEELETKVHAVEHKLYIETINKLI